MSNDQRLASDDQIARQLRHIAKTLQVRQSSANHIRIELEALAAAYADPSATNPDQSRIEAARRLLAERGKNDMVSRIDSIIVDMQADSTHKR